MDVYVVQVNLRSSAQPIGVYADINRAREEADVHAAASFGEITQTESTTTGGVEMRIHLKDGNPVASHAIYRFTVDEEIDNSDLPEPEFKPKRRITFEDV